jgi:flavin-dependent dehydrogenase
MRIAQRRDCDVLVCGGGTAGLGAALAAARNGAKTILIERHGYCGGICVSSLVHTFDGARDGRNPDRFVVGGIPREVIDCLDQMNGLVLDDNPPETLNFDPEAMKLVSDQLLRDASVTVYYHLFAAEAALTSDHVDSVIAAGKEGLWEFRPKVVVDTTGDGDISYFAGAAFEKDGMLQTMSQHFRIGGLTGTRNWRHLEHDCRKAMDRAYAEGRAPKYGGPWLIRIRAGEVTANCTRLYGDGTNTEDLSRAESQGREDMMSILEIFRRDIPDFRSAYILTSAPEIGVRETRRIVGDYQVTGADVLECHAQPDPIALGSWPIDIHPADGRVGVHPHKENPPKPYPIPSRALLVKNTTNLLVAGRCLSATHEAHGSTRVSGTAMATGEAAGTLAALASCTRRNPRDVPYSELCTQLTRQRAILHWNHD